MYELINDLVALQGKKAARSKCKPKSSYSLRKAILELAADANSNVPVERHVTPKSVITVAERSLNRTAKLETQTRIFTAYRDVASFILFAISGHTQGVLSNTDLLPIGHPYATRKHRMSEFSLQETRARWIAADPRIDNSVREIVASAYSYPLGSEEHVHACARLSAMPHGFVPREIILDAPTQALVAVAGLGIGGNSSAARSARARLQRRDRNGQFAYEGGGIQFFMRGLKGAVTSVVGKFVGNSLDSDGFIVEVKKDPVLKDGLYKIPAVKSEAVKAILPSTGGPAQEINLPSGVEAVELSDLKPLDAPDGWETTSTKKEGDKGPDKTFKSGDGYVVEYYAPGNEDIKGAVQKAWKYNTPFGSSLSEPPSVKSADGKTGPQAKLSKDEPVYILYRDKTDLTSDKSVAIAQDWADVQEFAAADEKGFDESYAKAQAQAEKYQKSVEESKVKQAEFDKKKADVAAANAETRAELEALALQGKDVNGNDVPEGWQVLRNDNALYPASEYDLIDKNKAFGYTRDEQNVAMSVYMDENGNLVFDGKTFDSWNAIEEAVPEYVKGKIQETREKAKEVAKPYDDNGDIAAMIDSNATPEQVLEELKKNPQWKAAIDDLETSWAVDLPKKSQKESWAALQKSINIINSMKPAYVKKTPETKAVLDKTPESTDVPEIAVPEKPTAVDVSKSSIEASDLIVPDGAYKLQLPTFEPEGRIDQDSKDYTDDPKSLANKFTTTELTDALAQALIAKTDYATQFIDELDQIGEDDEEDTGKKKKTGPKPKKPEKPKANATGYGALNFNQGEEFVPAEAIYQALEEQGVDAKMAAAQLYDIAMGENKNVDMIAKSLKGEDVKALEPSVLLDSEEIADIENMIQLNSNLAQTDAASTATAMIDEFSKDKDPNPRINEMADELKKITGEEGAQEALDKFIEWGLNGDEDQKQAFRGMFAVMLSADGGYAAPGEGSMFKTMVDKAIEKYQGSPATIEQVDALFEEYGYWTDLLDSKKKLATDQESINDKNSIAGAFYRLIAQMQTPNQVELYRGIQVEENSDALKKMIDEGSIISLDPRSFSIDKGIAGKFSGALTAKPATGMNSVIFTVRKGDGTSVNISSLSPFSAEQEHIVAGNFKISEVRKKTTPNGHTLYNVQLEKISKRDSVLEGFSNDFNEFLLENNSVDLPEGYYVPSTDAYSPMEEKDASLPDEFDDSPLTIARMWAKDDLIEVYRGGIEDGTGKANLIYPDGYEAALDVEAVRDALQIQGVDTNEIMSDIANTSPDVGVSDEETPAVESNTDDPIAELANDVGSEYDMAGWKQVGQQLGSNKGGFYEDAEGNRFYVKEPKSDLHAQNEALASALYRALGIDAAEIYIGSGEDGKKKTYSPDIVGSKQDLQEKLKDPEYLAKLQEGFAVDAWLANWDVAGLVFDNVMSDGDGNPVRVDPGGALLFRAQGAPKGKLFGNDVNELDTLRDPNMNPQSASIFGSMTDEQQKASAAKLLDISHDDIDTLVDTIVEDKNVADKLKDTLKARRQFILDRYGLTGDDTSLIAETTDVTDQDPDVQASKATDSVESRMETLYDWADSYGAADDNYTTNPDDQEKFKEIANQVDAALVDYRNGDITDDGMPQVIDELKSFIQTYNWSDDEKTQSNVDDLVDQLDMIKSNFYAPKPEDVTPAPVEPATDAVVNPYVTSDGMPIDPGMKVKYVKTGETGTVIKYDKGNTNYVYVQMDGETKPKVKSTKQLSSIPPEGGEGASPKAPEPSPAPEPSEPEQPETQPVEDVGQFEPTAQLTEDGTKVRVSFIVDGARPFNPNSDTGPNNYEEVMPYVVDSKLDVDGVDEVTVEVPLDKMDQFAKDYKEILGEKLVPGEFYGDVYNEWKEKNEPAKLQLHAQWVKDLMEQKDQKISDEKAQEIVDTINENDLIDKWSEATDDEVISAIVDVVGPGMVDVEERPAQPDTGNILSIDTTGTVDDVAKQIGYAIKNKKDITFNYNGKTRNVTPMSIWTNPKNGNVNMYGIDNGDDGKKKNFTLTNIESVPGGAPAPEIPKQEDVTPQEVPNNIPESEKIPETPEVAGPPKAPEGAMKISDVNGNDVFQGVEVTDKKGNKGTVLKVNKDNYALVQFEDGSKGWRSANTISTTGNVNSAAVTKAYKPKAGKITPAGTEAIVVDNPLAWNSSDFEGTPSLLDAIELVQTPDSKTAPMRGASAAVDSDSIEDLDVRVMKVRNADGEDSLQFKFKLTSWAGNAKAKELLKITSKEEAAALGITRTNLKVDRLDIGEDGVGQISTTKHAWDSNGGYTWTIKTDDGIVIKINRANTDATNKTAGGKYSSGGRAFHNLVTITAPAGATPEQIAKALNIAGVQDVRPAMQKDAQILIENRLMSVLDAKTDATKNLSGTERAESLARIEKKYGITPADVIVTTGASGRLETRLTPEAAQKIVDATGKPEALQHNLNISIPTYNMSNDEANEARAEWLANLLSTPQGGLLSTTTRWTEGIGNNGMSSAADVGTGGADYVFTRPIKSADAKVYGTNGTVLYFDPNKVYQRLDFYANYSDAFGKRQSSQDVISAAKVGAYEVMFKQRLGWDDLDVMVVPNQAVRTALIQKLRQKGIDELGGKPLEQAIIIGSKKEEANA